MTIESNNQKYLREIPQYQSEAKHFAWISLPFFVACGYFVLDSYLSGDFSRIVANEASDTERTLFVGKIAIPALIWHELFSRAEQRISRMKQAVRDYRNSAGNDAEPIKYTKTAKIINTLMLFHDNSRLPPEE